MRMAANLPGWARRILAAVVVWDLVWRGMALWRAAKRREPIWFVSLLVLNTAGVLPIVYLVRTRAKAEVCTPDEDGTGQPDADVAIT